MVMLEDPSTTHLHFWVREKVLIEGFMVVTHPFSLQWGQICLRHRKTAPKHISISVLDCGDVIPWIISLPSNTRAELMQKSKVLVCTFSPNLSESFKCSLTTFRRVCTCGFLNRGILWSYKISADDMCYQWCSLWLWSQLPLDHQQALLIQLLSHDHPNCMWQDLARSSRPKAINSHCIFQLKNYRLE